MHFFTLFINSSCQTTAGQAAVPALPQLIDHQQLKSYMNQGNTLKGIATPNLGAAHLRSVAFQHRSPIPAPPCISMKLKKYLSFCAEKAKRWSATKKFSLKRPAHFCCLQAFHIKFSIPEMNLRNRSSY